MFCPKCKKEYSDDDVVVCPECGTELVQQTERDEIVALCAVREEKVAEELVEYLAYSDISGAKKVKREDGTTYAILVPKALENEAKKVLRGYILAVEEERKKIAAEAEEKAGKEEEMDSASPKKGFEYIEEKVSKKKTYVKKADQYKDMHSSGIIFLIFGILGTVYLILCKTGILPIGYNVTVFWVLCVHFLAFIIGGSLYLIKAGQIKKQIPEEELLTKQLKEWLDTKVTEDKIAEWSDKSASFEENELRITMQVRKILLGVYPDLMDNYLEMIADEYCEEKLGNE